MQTSSIEIREIEKYLCGSYSGDESLLFQAKLILDPDLATNVECQKKTYRLIEAYSREKMKQELREVEKTLFTNSAFVNFRKKILKIFNK
jgi:hypothetical protein